MSQEGININLGDATDPFAAIDEGEYTLSVVEASLGASKSSGNAMVSVELEVIGDPDNTGHKIYENYVLEGKGAKFGIWRFAQFCKAVGLDTNGLTPNDIDYGSLTGRSFNALVEKVPPREGYSEKNGVKSYLV